MIFKSVYVIVSLALVHLINPSADEKANIGTASYYAKKFEGRRTASGQRYRSTERTAAHRTYPFGTLLEIINQDNGLKTIVRVNDRGPYIKSRLIDLSYLAAKDLGLLNSGTADVTLKVISLGKLSDVQIVDRETEIEFESSEKTSNTEMFLPFKPELLEKKYQYIKVVKQPGGNSKIEYLDSRQK